MSSVRSRQLADVEVLVIDDEPDGREVVAEILELAGARVQTAASVDEALAILDGPRPHVVVSDIGMPEKDGYALIAKLRTCPRNAAKPMPVIALTAFARDEDRVRCLASGFSAYMTKPFEPAALTVAVMNVLGWNKVS